MTTEKDEIVVVEPKEIEAVTPASLLQIAVSQGADLDKLEKLMDLQERYEKTEARKAYVAAMASFKENPPVITRDKQNKQYTSEYTSLGNLINTVNPELSKNGLSAKWDIEQGDKIKVTCIMTHSFGHSESVSMEAPPDDSGKKNPIQQIKSTITYLKAVTFESITGLSSTDANLDDDGNSAGPEHKGAKTHSDFIEEVDKKEDPFGYVKENKDTLLETLSNPEYAKLYQYAKFLEDSRNEPMPANVFKDKVAQINKLETKADMKLWWEKNVIGKWLTEEDIGGLRAVFVTRGNELEAK